jgi:O-antigen/teichoic acid export membrane protein
MTVDHLRYVLKFTVPLIPHSASLWALTSLSRPAMAAVSSLDQVGLLSFGLNLASVAILVLSESNRAALPHYSREIFPAPGRETIGAVRWQLIGSLVVPAVVGSCVAVAGPWIFAEAYWPSFFLTGILLIGQTAYGLYLIPMNYLTQTAGLPKYSAAASGAGAVLILVSILLLGHRYGAVGVAYATTAGYLTMMAVAMILMTTHKLDIAWSSWLGDWPAVVLGVCALACSVAALASPVGSTIGWTFAGGCLLLVVAAIVLTVRRKHSWREASA